MARSAGGTGSKKSTSGSTGLFLPPASSTVPSVGRNAQGRGETPAEAHRRCSAVRPWAQAGFGPLLSKTQQILLI
jgi:hypothetical protein